MKKIILLTLFIAVTYMNVRGQSHRIKIGMSSDTASSFVMYLGGYFEIFGFGDTATAIRNMIGSMKKKDSMCEAARNIAMMVTTTGYVNNKDRARFNKAIDEFYKQWSYKRPPAKMLWLDILIRDKNGKVLGRALQK